ncbi:MAG TPA: DUF192 domain-containing protein [Patescibacteria group bacterium]|nr:DUF192 domain-containing protein [Patescibacteria group bacterium]
MKQTYFIIIALAFIAGIGLIIVFFAITSRPNRENSLKKSKITIGGVSWEAEKAQTLIEKARGLSYRESLDKDKGMIFFFDPPSKESFWMKGMNFSLDMIWIRDNAVIDITKNAPPLKDSLRPLYYSPKEPADMVLEINAGQADEYGIQIGDVVVVDRKQ